MILFPEEKTAEITVHTVRPQEAGLVWRVGNETHVQVSNERNQDSGDRHPSTRVHFELVRADNHQRLHRV